LEATSFGLHLAVKRHGISQLPRDGGQKREKKLFKHYPIGYLHIDISEARTVLTDNGTQFAKKAGTEAYKPSIFDVVCYRHGTEHRQTRPFHPWTNGQVERMNRTLKEATIRTFHYTSLAQLQSHLEDYL
ncbi:integrase core domain-containing protein, partial [Vreelandella nanhaiensis]